MVSQEQNLMSPSQLRQRRARIIRDKAKEQKEEKVFRDMASKSSSQTSVYMIRLYVVIGTAMVVTIIAALNYSRPSFLYKRRKKQPPYYLATMYPPKMIVERDLPRFFRTYSIATPQNKVARMAVRRVASSRKALKTGNGNLQLLLKAWDASNIDHLLQRDICGPDFSQAYHSGSQERQEDLVMWCLLTTRIAEGFFLESVDMIESALIVARRRGMIVKSSSSDSGVLNAYYLHPRNLLESNDSMAIVPSKVMIWLLANPEDVLSNPSESRRMLQEHIYELVSSDEIKGNYMVLEEVCQPDPPKRVIGKQCASNRSDCCYFVVPEAEGGRFGDSSSSDDEEDGEKVHRRSLREGGKDADDTPF
jgi:hypothetical protein